MIARVWEGVVSQERAPAYGEYLRGPLGVLDYLRTPGNQGATLMRREERGQVRFLLISYWTSRESIAAYAGSDIEKARYHPFDLECLINPSPQVHHYEVMNEPAP